MKSFGLAFALLLGALGAHAAPEPAIVLRFRTVSFSGRYAPQHVLAVWIEDARGRTIRTLETRGNGHLRHLTAWKRATRKKDSQTTDGVTGATLASHGTHEIVWNGSDEQGQAVPDGDYVFLAEFTEDNGKGKLLRVPFRKGPKPVTLRPADEKHFTNLELTVSP